MRFSSAELAEIRHAFHQRIATERVPKKPARRKPKLERAPKQPARRTANPGPVPMLVREPACEGGEILRPAEVAEFFEVTPRTVRRWADSALLPSFRTIGGQRRFRWADVKRRLNRAGAASP
jgi:excisionase family DNA binding protein